MLESLQSPAGSGVIEDGSGGFRVANPGLCGIPENTASRAGLVVSPVPGKAIVNKALIKEQVRFGRRWQLRKERDRTANVDFA